MTLTAPFQMHTHTIFFLLNFWELYWLDTHIDDDCNWFHSEKLYCTLHLRLISCTAHNCFISKLVVLFSFIFEITLVYFFYPLFLPFICKCVWLQLDRFIFSLSFVLVLEKFLQKVILILLNAVTVSGVSLKIITLTVSPKLLNPMWPNRVVIGYYMFSLSLFFLFSLFFSTIMCQLGEWSQQYRRRSNNCDWLQWAHSIECAVYKTDTTMV